MVNDYHISKTPVELPTFLFSGNYRSPIQGLLLNINIWVNFQLFYQLPTVKFYKTIFRFTLFNLHVDHLHIKLITVSWKVGVMQIFATSKRSLGISKKNETKVKQNQFFLSKTIEWKTIKRARGLLRAGRTFAKRFCGMNRWTRNIYTCKDHPTSSQIYRRQYRFGCLIVLKFMR